MSGSSKVGHCGEETNGVKTTSTTVTDCGKVPPTMVCMRDTSKDEVSPTNLLVDGPAGDGHIYGDAAGKQREKKKQSPPRQRGPKATRQHKNSALIADSIKKEAEQQQGVIDALKQRIPCKYYARGSCRQGDACPYSHCDEEQDDFDPKANVYVPRETEVDDDTVPKIGDDMFVTRVTFQHQGLPLVFLTLFVGLWFYDLYYSFLGFLGEIPSVYTTVATILLTGVYWLAFLDWLLVAFDCIEVRAKTAPHSEDLDDRPTTDRGKDHLKGEIGEIMSYYLCLKLRILFFTVDIRGDTMPKQIAIWLYCRLRHPHYMWELSMRGVHFGQLPIKQLFSTSLMYEIRNRKTFYTVDPQYNTLAQRTDNVGLGKKEYDLYGVNVGNNSIRLCLLQHDGMETQPFVNRLPRFGSSLDIGFMTRPLTLYTRTLNQLLEWFNAVVLVVSTVLNVLQLLVIVAFTALVIACIVQIPLTMSASLPDVRNASLSALHDVAVGCEGIWGGLQSFSSKSWNAVVSYLPWMHQQMLDFSSGFRTPITESTGSSASFIRSMGRKVRFLAAVMGVGLLRLVNPTQLRAFLDQILGRIVEFTIQRLPNRMWIISFCLMSCVAVPMVISLTLLTILDGYYILTG
jgi:hypothetical protein